MYSENVDNVKNKYKIIIHVSSKIIVWRKLYVTKYLYPFLLSLFSLLDVCYKKNSWCKNKSKSVYYKFISLNLKLLIDSIKKIKNGGNKAWSKKFIGD